MKTQMIDLLKVYPVDKKELKIDENEFAKKRALIEKALLDCGIEATDIQVTMGNRCSLFEITTSTSLDTINAHRIFRKLQSLSARVVIPMPKKNVIGIEVENNKTEIVSMYSVINSQAFKKSTMELPVALGKTIVNSVYVFDLAKMPHLLIAGATGQGKSNCLTTIITSLLYKKNPDELKFLFIDPKMVEYTLYEDLKNHYLLNISGNETPIITDCDKAIYALNSLVEEMESRYRLLMNNHCRNIVEYNKKATEKGCKKLPYIVVMIDEYGDFMMQAGKMIETPITRIAHKARAVGMHLILATQRPSVKVITAPIKANILGRIAFRTASGIESSTILDERGAECLAGKGDLLISTEGKTERVQCAYVDMSETEKIVEYIVKNEQPCSYQIKGLNYDELNSTHIVNMESQNMKKAEIKTKNKNNEKSEPLPTCSVHPLETCNLNDLIGLESVKAQVISLRNYLKMQQLRNAKGLKSPIISNHLVFIGNAGTGKTTVARIIAKIYKDLGVLKKGHLVETDRSGLVANYVGQTATKTNKIVDSALDGVLFIDEAYSLTQSGSSNDYGQEAITTLIKRMEDNRDRLVVIFSGYPNEMQHFIESNPGLRSRINRYINFPDYTISELMQIFDYQCKMNDYIITDEAKLTLEMCVQSNINRKKANFGNARFIRNAFENIIHNQANRLSTKKDLTDDEMQKITVDDIVCDELDGRLGDLHYTGLSVLMLAVVVVIGCLYGF